MIYELFYLQVGPSEATETAILTYFIVGGIVGLAGLAAFLTALLVLAIGLVGVPLALRFRCGVRSGGVPAFVGGIPVIVPLLLVAGFGLG